MKISVSGTYSAGKTSTVMALSHYLGVPRTLARTIRAILPEAVPGKALAEVTPAEFLHLMLRRHCERAVAEAKLGDTFLSDGSSLQEWLYGAARVAHGMNPNATAGNEGGLAPETSDEMRFFGEVVDEYGKAFRTHVRQTYDVFIHLEHELEITSDGHRPMNKGFRDTIDRMLLETVEEFGIPLHRVSGTMPERMEKITAVLGLTPVMSIERALELGKRDYDAQDFRLETERA
ncbi:AAA family ATPase [Kitasatospora brasiliensis]|uniref:AAA family ATPase n=1 Tax=Kitasatospora brasiliensis TaxID=3058040 RepID=UPI00293062D4|nr:AAA family ATPase [Kitasatospora sp. K002]